MCGVALGEGEDSFEAIPEVPAGSTMGDQAWDAEVPELPQATCLVEVLRNAKVPLRVRRSTRSPGMEGTPSKMLTPGAGASGWRRRKKKEKHYVLEKKITKQRSPRNQLCVSQKAQPTSVSILDCSKVLIISKQNVPCLPDRDWQNTPRRLKIIIQLKHRRT